jgi:HAD superfamily hydrolase (TIGR01509 family)
MHEALIFDLDMTLVDSLEACTIGANMIADRFGLARTTEAQILKAICLPTQAFWTLLWGRYEEEWNVFFSSVVAPKVFRQVPLFPQAEDILRSAKDKGFRLAAATNRRNPWLDLAEMGLAKFFDTAVGFADVPQPKPEPDMLLAAIKQLGVSPSQALYVGDALLDMACARAAGVRAVGLLQGGAETEALLAAGAFAVRPDLASSRDLLDC